MHVLNKVLVYKEEGFDFSVPEKERIDEARSIAENETEDYCGPVYDWRETENAGRWSDEYPKQVYFAQDDIDWFIAEINEAVSSQKLELNPRRTVSGTINVRIAIIVTMYKFRNLQQSKRQKSAYSVRFFGRLCISHKNRNNLFKVSSHLLFQFLQIRI